MARLSSTLMRLSAIVVLVHHRKDLTQMNLRTPGSL
nr:MAG TPA: hypothetical protein [Caudoviricetes sp.]